MTIRMCRRIIICSAHQPESTSRNIILFLAANAWKNICFSLRYLSLRMCKLSDNGVQKIANELRYQDPPNDPKLIALNVADNDITDIGAEYIAAMLRTNRLYSSQMSFRILFERYPSLQF